VYPREREKEWSAVAMRRIVCCGGESDFDGGSFLLFCSDLLLSLLPMFLVCFVSETVFDYFIFLLVWLLIENTKQ
jgi:hypothetical protein